MAASLHDYFSNIANQSRDLMNRLPIAREIEPLPETFGRLRPIFADLRADEVSRLQSVLRPPPRSTNGEPAGMNTIGILADRLTILVCKEWYVRNRQKRPADADEVGRQIGDIVSALAAARPGHPKLLEKVSSRNLALEVASFEEAYYGLLEGNILLWETQEMLYLRDMESVPAEDLRDYIRFFSQANMQRNAYISYCEQVYWSQGAS